MLCSASGKKAQEGRNIALATLQTGKRCLQRASATSYAVHTAFPMPGQALSQVLGPAS